MDAYNAGINQNTGENLRHSESGVGGQSMQTADAYTAIFNTFS
jgi:hypothetical protein